MNPAGPRQQQSTEAVHDAGGHVAELTFTDVRRADRRAAGTFLLALSRVMQT